MNDVVLRPTRWLAFLFLLCALPTGLRLAVLTPMGQVADEPAHIARADGLLSGQIFGRRLIFTDPSTHETFPVSGVLANVAIVVTSGAEQPPGPARPLTAQRIAAAHAVRWSRHVMFDVCPNTVQYFPFFYLPASIGIGLGRLIGLSPLDSLFAGRLMMLLSYVGMGFGALVAARWGKGVLFLLLTLPMALSLGASINQDGQLLAATALAVALLTGDPAAAPRRRLCGIVLLVLMICSKPPYGLLLFVALVPVTRPHFLRRFGRLSLFALAPVVWVGIMMAVSMVPFHGPAYHPGPLWPGSPALVLHGTDPEDNLRVLLAHPLQIVLMPLRLIPDQWHNFIRSAVGVLGWLSVPLHEWQYWGWYGATIVAVAGLLAAPNRWGATGLDCVFTSAIIIASIFAIELAQYLSWTSVGATSIDGVTGRYYLLFLPFLLFALPRLGIAIDHRLRRPGLAQTLEYVSAIPAIVMAGLDVYALPSLIGRVFHT